MAVERRRLGLWLAVAAILFLAATGTFWLIQEREPVAPSNATADPYVDSIQVMSWNWKDDRSGSVFAVYGVVRNLGSQDIRQVVMDLRAEDADGQPVGRYPIVARDVPAGDEKPFREDVPRTGREATGYLEVRYLVR